MEILTGTVENVLQNPIYCGYLLAFCKAQYCAENVSFIIAVNTFKLHLRADQSAWRGSSWKDLDAKYAIGSSDFQANTDEPWPSSTVSKDEVLKHMDKIWETFLSDDASMQICLPSKVMSNILRRLKLVHVYGPDVYDEATLDPHKTIRRDIMPRFLASQYFVELEMRAESMQQKPTAASLSVDPPTSITIAEEVSSGMRSPDLSLNEFLIDKILYNIFLQYLQSIVSSENLLCIMMIKQFEEAVRIGQKLKVNDLAWAIYLYFVSPGSVFEVSVAHRQRREIMYGLAQPFLGMFKAPESTSMSALQENFRSFKASDSYRKLQSSIHSLVEAEKTGSLTSKSPALCGCI
jgi:hypothetical protein